jgi:two-component system cell cycle sensor histidine kinase/response regulator CckA
MENAGVGIAKIGRSPIRVLLIEDSPEDAELIIRRLEKGGYKVDFERVESEPAAKAALDRDWDLILCDHTLPHFSGYSALTIWKSKRCTTPFIFISGTLGEQAAVEALKQGASDYLLKDNLTRLIPAIERALRETKEREEREQERVRSERSLRTSEARFRALIENSSDGILVLSRQADVLFSSSAVQRILGYQSEGFAGHNFLDLTHPEDRHEAMLAFRDCAPGEAITCKLRIRHANWQWRVTECVYSNLTEEPVIAGIVVNFRDITEACLSEEALRKSEEKFSKSFRSSPLAFTISTKGEGRYLDVNEAFLRMLGYRRHEIIGHSALELGVWAKPEEREALLHHLDKYQRVTALRATFKTKAGELRETEIAAEPIDLGSTPCVLAITQDVTETRRLEAQFRHAQKMEAVGQLAGGIAHDFNNLLMVMRSYAQMIESENPNSRILDYTNRIVEAADKAAGVTRQLLAFSRRQPQELKTLDLNRVVRDFDTMLPGLIGEDIRLQISTKADGAIIFADQGQLEQVIMNLVVNSRDAMPAGGKLTIETADLELGENISEHHGARISPGSYVVLTVTDTGHGMSEETMARIFEPFFTTKGVGKGTGLGLATAYGIVKQHRGFIWVYSEVGLGTSFKIYLPKWRGANQSEVVAGATPTRGLSMGNETILIVEDQLALLDVISEYLASMGYKTLKAQDGDMALRVAASHVGPIQVLLTDVIMPGIRGPELATQMTKLRTEVRTIYMSGYSEFNLEGIEPSVVVHKPVDLGVLAQTIQRVLDNDATPNGGNVRF